MNSDRKALLAIDVGNTNVTLGLFDGELLSASWRISTDRRRMADEYRPLIAELLRSAGHSFAGIEAVALVSVVPPVATALSEAFVREQVKATVLSVSDFGVPVHYKPPASVGADRLANALAVDEKYGRPAIIVDLGTATTLDVLDSSGCYIGGAISPGIELSAEALFNSAFQLPRLGLEAPPAAIGRTTLDSIRSGAVFGWASLVDGLVDRFVAEMGAKPRVIATGGFAPLIAPHSRHIELVDLDLTLIGLRLAHDKLRDASQPEQAHQGPSRW
jgi:type III pantothenate kinase